MRINYLSDQYSGCLRKITVGGGTTIEQLRVHQKVADKKKFVVLVNGTTPIRGQILEEGDLVVAVPNTIKGDGPAGLSLSEVRKLRKRQGLTVEDWIYWEGYTKGYRDGKNGNEFDVEDNN